jgi:hypothetical protein
MAPEDKKFVWMLWVLVGISIILALLFFFVGH